MQIPESILKSNEKPKWIGNIEGEEVHVYYDENASKFSESTLYAVFSSKGFHGWVEKEYSNIELIWMATNFPIDYNHSLAEIKYNEEIKK
jgi:hypothetical protein